MSKTRSLKQHEMRVSNTSQVDAEIEMAREAFDDLANMEAISLRRRYTTLYYGVYHAAKAALLAYGYTPKTHSGVNTLVHQILYHKKDDISEDEARCYSKIGSRREQADYDAGFYGSEDEFDTLSTDGKQLADTLINLARDNTDQ